MVTLFSESPVHLGSIAAQCSGNRSERRTGATGWLPKLRDDQRAAKADIALIVTQELPKDMDSFNLIDGVWVPARYAMHLAMALRQSLIEVAAARKAGEGQQTKMEMLSQYSQARVSSPH